RRRHTRFSRDWSSDVCSSDLIFEHVRAKLELSSRLEALQEISKGKTTTLPDRHTGEGIFFTSKVADHFEITANGLRWEVDNLREIGRASCRGRVWGEVVEGGL